jgi:regulator of replication initiation timing
MKKQMRNSKKETRIYPDDTDSTLNNGTPIVEQLYQQIQGLKERLVSADTTIVNLMMENKNLKGQIRNLQQNSDTYDSKNGVLSGKSSEQSGVQRRTTRHSNEEKESDHIHSLVKDGTSLNVDPGVPVRSQNDETWNSHFLDLQLFKAKFGHKRVRRDYNEVLCEWVSRQRRVLCGKKKGFMDKSRLHALERIGFGGSEDDDSTNEGNDPGGDDGGKLTRKQANELQAFPKGIVPKDRLDEQWNMRFLELRIFRLKNGHCRVPAAYSKGLASWTIYQRQLFNGKKRGNQGETIGMNANRIAALTSLGMAWRDCHKARKRSVACKISTSIPKRKRENEGDSGSTVDQRRSSKRRSGTSKCRLPTTSAQSSDLEPNLTDHIVDDEEQNSSPAFVGHSLRIEITHDNKLAFVHRPEKTSSLTSDISNRTSHEDFAADAKAWESNFRRLKRFKVQKGHVRVAVFNDRSLFIWMNRQRKLYRGEITSGISKDRVDLLNSIGFDW